MDIPRYPEFRPLLLEDKPFFDQAFRQNPPQISEYTFTNIYGWRQAYNFHIAVLDGVIIVRSQPSGAPQFFEPIGSGGKKEAMLTILADYRTAFVRVSEETKVLFDNDSRIRIAPDADSADYLYSLRDLVELPGKKYDGKRNLIRNFKSAHSWEYISFSPDSIGECLKFEECWCLIKDCDSVEGLRNERQALREMVGHFSFFNLVAGGLKLDCGLAAVAVAEALNPDTLVMHILKADPNVAGLYQTMLNEFLRHRGGDFTYVNLEQDLGIEGLRKAKLSYHPERMVNKYTISLAQDT